MAAALGNPERDPHGDPIPTAELVMPTDKTLPLSSLRPNQEAVIQRVIGEEPAFLRHLEELGLVPGAQIEINKYSPFDHNLTIAVENKSVVLGLSITNKIFVEEIL